MTKEELSGFDEKTRELMMQDKTLHPKDDADICDNAKEICIVSTLLLMSRNNRVITAIKSCDKSYWRTNRGIKNPRKSNNKKHNCTSIKEKGEGTAGERT